MCLNPSKIADVGFVACRECWQCRERKVDDWVGRNIAEGKTASAAHVVTLTYGEDLTIGGIDHIRAAVLTYSDVQKFLKYLRVDGYPVRYFVVGEYGSKKGRAHWHIVLYWQGKVPEHKLRENFMQKHWPHGLSYWDKVSAEAIRYACKYLQKDMGDDARQGFGPMPSKKPPLGDAYFQQLAERYVDAGISPQDLFYSFADVRRVPHGTRSKTVKVFRDAAKPIQFMMSGKTADNFCRYFVEGWRAKYNDEPPQSPVIWAWLNKGLESYVESTSMPRFERGGRVPIPWAPPPGGTPPKFDERVNAHYSDVDGVRLWFSYDTEGDLGWHEKVRPSAVKQRLLAAREEAMRQSRYLAQSRGI
ncbi:rolling circle replication-associated protein [Pseudaminobacter sp. NGMCC 1.201702]|uniref:rolling circle replication-associated protein n=1 Tax=Pseudaminobacter sp. NGMCC 1.201702 TaxID=3391825 RepID=UPI0039F12D1C